MSKEKKANLKIVKYLLFLFAGYAEFCKQSETGGQNEGDDAMQEKILVGHKLRRFRKSIGLSQTAMAEALAISPSYLNLLEHNQRPLTVGLLLRLGNSFDIDLKDFAEDDAAKADSLHKFR